MNKDFTYPYSKDASVLISSDEFVNILELNKKSCLFCKPTSSKKIILDTPNFFVTIDDSPLLEGHLLLHSKTHFGCCGELTDELMDEFILLKNQIGKLIRSMYGVVSFYEHGRAGHCQISNDEIMCEHFHLHALPFAYSIVDEVNSGADAIKLHDLKELRLLFEQFDKYLLFENDSGVYFFPVIEEIPPHYLRSLIAGKILQPELSDWENSTSLSRINSFKEKLSRYEYAN